MIIVQRDRVEMAKNWIDRRDSMTEAERAGLWAWATQATDTALNGQQTQGGV
jgi:hypothetical protein